MVRVQSPLMSMSAQKQLGKTLIYKMKKKRAFVTAYSRPGKKNPFVPSESQVENRSFYTEAITAWQNLTTIQKDYWNNIVKEKNLAISGWNLFFKEAYNNPIGILGISIFGERIYGFYEYGNEPSV